MSISSDEAIIINRINPDTQKMGLGDELKDIQDKAAYSPIMIQVSITAAANATAKTVTIPYAFELVDVIVQARATSAGGTATVRKGTDAISDAIIMAADGVITRAGTLDDGFSTIATTDSINVITHGANDRGLVTLIGYRA